MANEQDRKRLDTMHSKASAQITTDKITDQNGMVEEELRLTQFSIDRVTEAIFRVGSDARFLYANEAACQMLGYTHEELLAMTFLDIASSFTSESWSQHWQTLKKSRAKVVGTEFQAKDGRVFPAEISVKYLEFNEKEYHFVSAHDITKRKQTEMALAKQAVELAAVAHVSTAAATILEPAKLLQEVVELTKSSFDLYHAHIYLFNEAEDTLVLTAGAGEVGQQMVIEGRRIPLAQSQSLVARAARDRKGVIVNDVRTNTAFLSHPLLPETRSEMAVPLIVGERVLGVLDVQADEVDRFTEADVAIQGTLAAQVAVALQNARSFERAEQTLDELNALSRRLTREGWADYQALTRGDLGYCYDLKQVSPLSDGADIVGQSEATLSQPLTVRGETIGHLTLSEPQALAGEAPQIVQAVTERLSAHLESLRLTEQTRKALAETEDQARRLSLLNEMGAALSQTTRVDEVFKIAIAKVLEIMNSDQANVALLGPKGDTVEIIGLKGEVGAMPEGASRPLRETDFERAIRERRLVVQFDNKQDSSLPDMRSRMNAPLIAGGQVIGTLNVGSKRSSAYTVSDQNLFLQIASLLASSIESQRLVSRLQIALAEAEALYNVSAKLNAATTLDEVLQVATSPAVDRGASFTNLFTIEVDEAGRPEWIELRATWEKQGRMVWSPGTRFHLTDFPEGHLWLDRPYEPLMVGNIFYDERIDSAAREAYQQLGVQATIVLPLLVGRNWIGLISIYWSAPQSFTGREIRFYRSVAAQTAILVNNQLLFSQTQEALARAEATQRLYIVQAWESYQARKTDVSYEQVQEGVVPLGNYLPPAVVQAALNKQTAVVTRPSNWEQEKKDGGDNQAPFKAARSSLLVPLTTRDQVIGVLGLEETDEARQWSPEEIALVEAIAEQMAEAAENLRLFDETQRRAAREVRVNEIGERIQGAQSLEEALQIAVKEVGLSLRAPETTVHLNVKK